MAFLDTLGDRQQAALDASLEVLTDDEWHTHDELHQAAANASDLTPKSINELIRRAWRAGHYRRTTTTKSSRAANALYRSKDRRP